MAQVRICTEANGGGEDAEDHADDEAIDCESECSTPEAGEFDAVELLQPLGLAGRKIAHGKSVAGGLRTHISKPRRRPCEQVRSLGTPDATPSSRKRSLGTPD